MLRSKRIHLGFSGEIGRDYAGMSAEIPTNNFPLTKALVQFYTAFDSDRLASAS